MHTQKEKRSSRLELEVVRLEYAKSPEGHGHIDRGAQRSPLLDTITPIPLKNLKRNLGIEISFSNTTELWCDRVTPPTDVFLPAVPKKHTLL